MGNRYKIVRSYHGTPGPDGHLQSWKRTIERGLTLEEAQAHCSDPETSYEGTSAKARRITRRHGKWFDTYTEE